MPDFRPLSDVQWTEALSRLHPLVLHLPIAILVVLLLVELPRLFRRSPVQRDATRTLLVALLFLSAPLTALAGYFLGHDNGYGPPIEWHERLGIATAVVSVLAALAYWRRSEHYPLLIVLGALLVVPTAHLGASMTHGADFLLEPWLVPKAPRGRSAAGSPAEGAPAALAQAGEQAVNDKPSATPPDPLAGLDPSTEGAPAIGPAADESTPAAAASADVSAPPTSEPAPPPPATGESSDGNGGIEGLTPPALATPKFTFDRDVLPIFEEYCFRCHSERKQKGELRLDSYDFLLAGSEYGSVFIPGNAAESRLVEMLRLDLMEDEHMPPENKPQPEEADITAIETWIDSL